MSLTKRLAIAGLSAGLALYNPGCGIQQSTNTVSNSSVDTFLLSQIDDCISTYSPADEIDISLPAHVGVCTSAFTYNFPELLTGDSKAASYTVCDSKQEFYGWDSRELETCKEWVDVIFTLCDSLPKGETCSGF